MDFLVVLVMLLVLVLIFVIDNLDFIKYTINYYAKPRPHTRLHDDEVEMDVDPDDVVWWEEPVLESIAEKPLPTLPDDVIVQILVRLPVRSLLQFRSVCNSWQNIISSPQFAKDHIHRSTMDTTMTHQRLVTASLLERLYRHGNRFVFAPVQSLFEQTYLDVENHTIVRMKGKFNILGSCNGLLCLYDISDSYVRLWNPSTRLRSEKSPVLLNGGPSDNNNITYCGFGHDHVHDKYKVLIVLGNHRPSVTKLYTFGGNSWTTVQDFPYRHYATEFYDDKHLGTFVTGTLHWLCRRSISANQRVIISFDLGNETYGEVSLPDRGDDKFSYPDLGVLSNSLCVCFENEISCQWVVWMMKKYGDENSWSRLLVIPHSKNRYATRLIPLFIWENGLFLGKTDDDSFVLHNSNDSWLKYPTLSNGSETDALIYHESLVSP